MDSRSAILEAIRQRRPAPSPRPEPVELGAPDDDLAERFARMVREVGGKAVEVEPGRVAEAVRACYPEVRQVASSAPEHLVGSLDLRAVADPHDLAGLDLLVCEAVLGVAENGAVWLPESRLAHRAAPFIAQHLAVVLDARHLVPDLHHAYRRLRVEAEGYGVFVAGPSKTADIEQSLVIGAHGPRSLTVLLLRPGTAPHPDGGGAHPPR